MDTGGGGARQLTFFKDELVTGHAWSPSGDGIVMCVQRAAGQRLGLIAPEGGRIQWLSVAAMGDCGVSWFSDTVIAYSAPGNRTFVLQSLGSGATRRLIENDSLGWIFNLVAHPRGSPALVWWNRSDARGVWTVSEGSQRLLRPGPFFPLRLDSAGTLLAFEYGTVTQFYRMNIGRPDSVERIASVPECVLGDINAAGTRIVCDARTSSTDIWLMRPGRATPVPRQ